jgi:hypothetical protein
MTLSLSGVSPTLEFELIGTDRKLPSTIALRVCLLASPLELVKNFVPVGCNRNESKLGYKGRDEGKEDIEADFLETRNLDYDVSHPTVSSALASSCMIRAERSTNAATLIPRSFRMVLGATLTRPCRTGTNRLESQAFKISTCQQAGDRAEVLSATGVGRGGARYLRALRHDHAGVECVARRIASMRDGSKSSGCEANASIHRTDAELGQEKLTRLRCSEHRMRLIRTRKGYGRANDLRPSNPVNVAFRQVEV